MLIGSIQTKNETFVSKTARRTTMSKRMAKTQRTPITEIIEVPKVSKIIGCKSIEVEIILKWHSVKFVKDRKKGSIVKREFTKTFGNVKDILPLREITSEEVKKYRQEGIPSFILKTGDSIYYTKIPKDISLTGLSLIKRNKCAQLWKECRRFSAASDEKGGCAKVRNCSRGIENFSWITGIETFNTKMDAFVVLECEHYEA